MENSKQEKELDLLDIISVLGTFLSNYILKPLGIVFRIGVRRWYVLLVALILGVALSVLLPMLTYKKNKAEVIIKNNVSQSIGYIKEIESLSGMNRGRLAALLNLDVEYLKNLVALKSHRVISKDSLFIDYTVDENDQYDKNSEFFMHPGLFSLEVLSKDTASLRVYTDAVLDYLNKKSSFSLVNERKLNIMRSELSTYKNETVLLDSLRYIQYFTNDANQVVLGSSGETFSIKEKNQWIQNDLMSLKSKIVGIEHKLSNDTLAVEKLTVLKVSDVYENHPSKTLKKYCLLFLIASYLLVIIYEYRKNIMAWLQK